MSLIKYNVTRGRHPTNIITTGRQNTNSRRSCEWVQVEPRHYGKGEVPEALRCYQDALRSKNVELGDDHPELAATNQHIGNCLSDQGDTDVAIAYFEEAIRLKELEPDGGDERDEDIASIEGVFNN